MGVTAAAVLLTSVAVVLVRLADGASWVRMAVSVLTPAVVTLVGDRLAHRSEPGRCACPRCARNLWHGSREKASSLLRGWAVRNKLAGARGDDEVPVLVRCDVGRASAVPHEGSPQQRWAAAVLMSWAAWFHGVQPCSSAQARWLTEAGRRGGWQVESCPVPGDPDERELLERLARRHPLELAARLARASLQ